jgi:hypothetical protein
MARPPTLEIQHATDGRVRLRPAKPMPPAALKALADALGGFPGIRHVVSRPNTGSLILGFDGPPEPVLEAVEASGLARPREKTPPPPIGMVGKFALLRANTQVKEATGGTLDLNSSLALIYAMGALVQLGRGRIASPASSLAMAALALLERGGQGPGSGK